VKIYANNTVGHKGPFTVAGSETEPPEDQILTAVFETVPEFAARIERENKERRR
jgi:hypothetical protein